MTPTGPPAEMLEGSPSIELVDAGDGRRLERFGSRIVDRPSPAAIGSQRTPEAWARADLRYERGREWIAERPDALDPWTIEVGGLTLELSPSPAGQLGIFPEHWLMVPWLEARIRDRTSARTGALVLNLFASSGLATLAAARAGATVTHVDASRPAVAAARRNAARSSLDERPIRWIVDDVSAFVAREARRGRVYDGLILDPPSYGHGRDGAVWRIEADLPALLTACARILADEGFALLTAHTSTIGPVDLVSALADALNRPQNAIERGELELRASSGVILPLGAFARTSGGPPPSGRPTPGNGVVRDAP